MTPQIESINKVYSIQSLLPVLVVNSTNLQSKNNAAAKSRSQTCYWLIFCTHFDSKNSSFSSPLCKNSPPHQSITALLLDGGVRCMFWKLTTRKRLGSLRPCGSFSSALSAADRLSVSHPPPPPPPLPPASQHCGSSPALPWPGSKDNEALEVRTPTERRRQRSDITGWSVCGRAAALGAAAGLTLHRGRAPPAR